MRQLVQQFIAFVTEVREALLAIPKNLSELRDTVEKQTRAIDDARDAYEQRHDASPVLRAELQVPHPIAVNTEPKDKHEGREILKLVVSILTLAFVATYTVFTLFIFCANNKAAKAAEDSVKLAEKNAHLEQRAWVAVSEIIPRAKGKSPWEIAITFKNTGHTPATNFVIQLAGQPTRKGERATGEEVTEPGHGIIPPDGFFHQRLSAEAPYNWKNTDLTIHGKITYDSVFGHSHWTRFCYYFVPQNNASWQGDFAPCDTGNDVDGDEP